jgi:3,4-dihydroxy 2-butanone 4-phosphate synthase/GTP cyclohydrolase II
MTDLAPIEDIIAELAAGRMVIIVDDEDRENEGDLVLAGDCVTPDSINFMAKHGRGLICLALDSARVRTLGLPPMARHNASRHSTAFTVSIEAREGITRPILSAPAMCFRWKRARAAFWCARGIPRRRSIWPGLQDMHPQG